jgi:CCR4-NOT transcription complex subunit 1
MRNLILSAFPRNMRLPDPFTPNLTVDLLPEISQSPRIVSDFTSALTTHRNGLQLPLDLYLKTRDPPAFPKQLIGSLTLHSAFTNPNQIQHAIKRAGTTWNVPLINSIVLYVGSAGMSALHDSKGQINQFQDNSCMDIFEALVTLTDAEGRYFVLNAIANQLRYPNTHTHYFCYVLLWLFYQSKEEVIKEQITRVLLERLIVHRPHPWGLLITFIELIRNTRYEFWRQPFVRCAPEIEHLFDSVAKSCIPNHRPGSTATSPAQPTNGQTAPDAK